MNYKNNSPQQNTTRPNLERFKYEVAQEMGLSARGKKISDGNAPEDKGKTLKNGKTF